MKTEATVIMLKQKIAKHEAEIKKLKKDLTEAEIILLAEWSESGVSRTTLDGNTLYVSRRLWAGGDTDELVAVLRREGLEDLIKPNVNRNTLTAWVKEVTEATPTMTPEEIHAALPKGVRDAIEVVEKITFGMRKA